MRKILNSIFLFNLIAPFYSFAAQGDYFDPRVLNVPGNKVTQSSPEEPIYLDTSPSLSSKESYEQRIQKIIDERAKPDQIQTGATELIELMEEVYKTANVDEIGKFDTSLQKTMEGLLRQELPLLVTFTRWLQAAEITKLFGEDSNPLIKQEFEALQILCKKLMQEQMNRFRTSLDEFEKLNERFTHEEVSRLLLEEYPSVPGNLQLIKSTPFQEKLTTGNAQDLKYFELAFSEKRIRDLTNNFTEFADNDFKNIVSFLDEMPNARDVINKSQNPLVKILIQSVDLERMLREKTVVNAESLAPLQNGLKENEIFTKQPKLWFAIAGRLIKGVASEGSDMEQFVAVERMLQSTIPSSGKKSSLGSRIATWFKNNCNFNRLRIQLRRTFMMKDSSRRYMYAIDLVRKGCLCQNDERVIAGRGISIEAKQGLMRDALLLVRKIGKNEIEQEKKNELMYELHQLDPEGTVIYKDFIQQLDDKAMRQEFTNTLYRLQNGAAFNDDPVVDENIIVEQTGPEEGQVTDLIDATRLRKRGLVPTKKPTTFDSPTTPSSILTNTTQQRLGELSEQEKEQKRLKEEKEKERLEIARRPLPPFPGTEPDRPVHHG